MNSLTLATPPATGRLKGAGYWGLVAASDELGIRGQGFGPRDPHGHGLMSAHLDAAPPLGAHSAPQFPPGCKSTEIFVVNFLPADNAKLYFPMMAANKLAYKKTARGRRNRAPRLKGRFQALEFGRKVIEEDAEDESCSAHRAIDASVHQ